MPRPKPAIAPAWLLESARPGVCTAKSPWFRWQDQPHTACKGRVRLYQNVWHDGRGAYLCDLGARQRRGYIRRNKRRVKARLAAFRLARAALRTEPSPLWHDDGGW